MAGSNFNLFIQMPNTGIFLSYVIVTLYVYILIQNKPHIFDHFLLIQSSGLEYW